MKRFPRRLVEAVCRLLPADIAGAAAGDLEEQWRRDAGASSARATVRLAVDTLSLLWCAWRARRVAPALVRDERRVFVLSMLLRDLRYAVRVSRREPRATLVALLTLALGLGAATALFALTNAWLLRPLPFRAARDLVAVWETIPSQQIFQNTPAPAVLFDWRARARSFTAVGALTTGTINLTGGGEPERLGAIRADDDLVRVLALQPALGRMFDPSATAAAEVVLSDAFWRRRFGASRDVVGSTLTLDGAPTVVVGVLPRDVSLLGLEADVWVPLRFSAQDRASLSRYLWVVGRLRAGATVEQASADVDAIAQSRQAALGARAVSLQEETVGSLAHDLPILLGATGVLLFVACANVASLTLARATARRREFALRAALGAGRARLALQVVVEALPAGLLGGAGGLLLSAWLVRAFTAVLPQSDRLSSVTLTDPRVFAFGLAASLAAAVLFALAPALHSASRRTLHALREGERGHSGPSAPLRMFAAIEIALAVALLIAAAVVGRSFVRLTRVDLGVRTDDVVTFELPRTSHDAFYDELLRRLGDSPAVRAAALSQALPLKSFGFGSNFPVEGAPPEQTSMLTYWRIVSPQYFDTLGIALKAGRAFDAHDRVGAPLVAIVSESYARAAWPSGESPIGKRIGWATLERPMTVVGVVADIRLSPAAAATPHVYMPYAQVEQFSASQLAVRASGGEAQAIDAVRRAVWALDPAQPVANIQPMRALAWKLLARRRFQLTLWAGFAVTAALLALLGVYGVVSYGVRRSSKEIGIRLALGARPAAVVARVVGQGMALAAAGAAAGVVIAYWTAEIVRGFVIGIEPRDPWVYAAVTAIVLAGAAVAALLPARRAARIDPLESIRGE